MSSGPIYAINYYSLHEMNDDCPFKNVYFKTRSEAQEAIKHIEIDEGLHGLCIVEVRPTTVGEFIDEILALRDSNLGHGEDE
jgi:hypothetical protein